MNFNRKLIINMKQIHSVFLILPLFVLLCFTIACKKERTMLPAPSIEILSATTRDLSTYVVELKIDLGEGQEVKNANLVFDDITLISKPDIIKEIPITQERNQEHTISLHLDELNHDFAVKGYIETENYSYYSNEQIIRSKKNTFRPYILVDDMYGNDEVAKYLNQGSRFSILVNYSNIFTPKTVEIALNKDVFLEHTLDFSDPWFGDGITCLGFAYLPPDLPTDIYEVSVFVDGHEFISEEKIEILEGRWSKIDSTYPGEARGDYASFLLGDDIYIAGGEYTATLIHDSPVWKYNHINKQWTQLTDFPHPGEVTKNEIYSYSLKYQEQGMLMLKNADTVELWKYDELFDDWDRVNQYPGIGTAKSCAFIINNKLYVGGGYDLNKKTANDFWSYDFNTSEWKQLNDIPFNSYDRCNPSQIHQEKAWVFTFYDGWWMYEPETDSWIRKADFPGPERVFGTLTLLDDNMYLIGGLYYDLGTYGLKDCWQYSISQDKWELKAFLPALFSNGISYNYRGNITYGLGFVTHGYSHYDVRELYQFSF